MNPWAILVAVSIWMTPAPVYSTGSAVWYAPGIMEAQFVYRGWDRSAYVDGVALMSPADLGKTVWLRRPGHVDWEGPFLSVDCAMRGDMAGIILDRHEVVEVGWRTAARWGLGPHDGGWRLDGVEVLVDPAGPIWWAPVEYEEWFRSLVDVIE
jgi:hypothetical protein